jgi:hypothetical protein
MSVVKRWWSKLDGKDSREVAKNFLRCTLNVVTSRPYTYTQLRSLPGIPRQNEEHEDEPGFYLENIDPEKKDKFRWALQCEFTPFKLEENEKNPLDRSPDISYDSSLVETPTFFDVDRKPMTTTAGEFIQGIMMQIPIVDYTVKVNLPNDPPWILTHLGGVNSNPIKIRGLTWPKKTLLVAGVSGSAFTIENKVKFTEIGLRVLGDPRGFEQKVWNRGTMRLRQLPTSSANPKKNQYFMEPIKTGDPPEYVDEPVPLDEKGAPLEDYLNPSPGDKKPIKPGKLIELTFNVQKSVNFRDLPLS